MELQLGLALPTHDHIQQGLDCTNIGLMKSKQVECSELWRPCCSSSSSSSEIISRKHFKNKRSFEDYSFGNSLKTLNLLVWSGQPNEDDDDRSGKMQRNNHNSNKNEEDENRLVGWPPIKSWRKKELHQHQYQYGAAGRGIRNNNNRVLLQADDAENQSRVPNSFYVKVNMEGVTIGRKINLRLYDSYQTLTNQLITMFAKYQKIEKDGATYTLTFQNEQGDWLIARHVPWQLFIGTVRRLAILRNAN